MKTMIVFHQFTKELKGMNLTNENLYTFKDIVDITCYSLSKIKVIISKMGIVPVLKKGHLHYYDFEQVELIKENDNRNYQSDFIILQSKINFGY